MSVCQGVTTLVVFVFTPSLLFVNVAETMSTQLLLNWWPLPVFAALYVGVGAGLGLLLALLTRLPARKRNWVIVALAFRNTVSIPLALVAQLAGTLAILLAGPDDTPQKAARRGEAYILFYSAIISAVRWTLGERLLRPPAPGRPRSDSTTSSSSSSDSSEALMPPPPPPPPPPAPLVSEAAAGESMPAVPTLATAPRRRRARWRLRQPSWRDRELSNLMMLSVVPALGRRTRLAGVPDDGGRGRHRGGELEVVMEEDDDGSVDDDDAVGLPAASATEPTGAGPDVSYLGPPYPVAASRAAARQLGSADVGGVDHVAAVVAATGVPPVPRWRHRLRKVGRLAKRVGQGAGAALVRFVVAWSG